MTHNVYPDSTLEEIQLAIDAGGIVYFHCLAKKTKQYAQYDQVASSTLDLPPSPASPPKGFNIGQDGKSVSLIGVPGPNGESPVIKAVRLLSESASFLVLISTDFRLTSR